MPKAIIEISGLGKRYRIGANKEPYLSLRDEVTKWFSPSVWRTRKAAEEFWALKNIALEIQPGESVGIIGHNGAGKSTLLKILSQITPPTEGVITMRGRVASLLEVGTGFHPELTGRENIYLNGAILGMTRKEITRKFDEIVSFAEVEKFLDTPVKRYSSGMYVRLAFAVAAHLEPEILVVDEVLSVGDFSFQKKCLGKMGEVAKSGRTVFFVSHNLAAVKGLCQRAAVLETGKLKFDGATGNAIAFYLESSSHLAQVVKVLGKDKDVGILDVWFRDKDGQRLTRASTGMPLDICIAYRVRGQRPAIRIAAEFYGALGEPVTCCDSYSAGEFFDGIASTGVVVCSIPRLALLPGRYNITFSFHCNGIQIELLRDAIRLDVESGDYYGTGIIPPSGYGSVLMDHSWKKDHLNVQ